MDLRNAFLTLVGFGVAAVVLGILAVIVGVEAVARALGRADPAGVGAVGTAIIAWVCFWGLGLRVVLAAVGPQISIPDAILVNASAAFANHITPFGQAGGEPVTAWLLSDVGKVDIEEGFAAIASFDAINVVPSLSLAAIGLTYYASVTTLGSRFRLIGTGMLVIGVALLMVLVLLWRRRNVVEVTIRRIVGPPLRGLGRLVPRIDPPDEAAVAKRVSAFVDGLERVATDKRRLTLAVGFSSAGWIAQAIGLWLALAALGAHVPWYVPTFVVPMGTVASALPTPGGLGGIETLQVALLVAATSASPARLTAAVAIFSVGGFLLTTSLGGAAIVILRLKTRSVTAP